MKRELIRHKSGEVYIMDLDTRTWPVVAVGGPYQYEELALEVNLENFDLGTFDVDWAEDEFNAGNLRIISRTEI